MRIPKKTGRPIKPVDWDRVNEMLIAGCLGTEVAAYFDINPMTFYRKVEEEFGIGFTEYAAKYHGAGNTFIREAQFQKAIKSKDNTMLIWLGKQRLGQKENLTQEVDQDTTNHYLEVISQLASLQSARKMEDSKQINEQKSA